MRTVPKGLIIYEDEWLLAVNKPPRVASVPGEGLREEDTLLGKVRQIYEGKGSSPYVLHRLDFETSGLMLFGKNPRDRETLEGIVGHGETLKTYVALVKGVPAGKVIARRVEARESDEKIPAETFYRVKKVFKGPVPLMSLVEADIKTGRKHQIRKHFAMIGHPIIMDRVYGDEHFNRKFRLKFRLGRQFLHAYAMQFMHPFLKKSMRIEAKLSPDLVSTLNKMMRAQKGP